MTKLRPWLAEWPAGRHPGTVPLRKASGQSPSAGSFYYEDGAGDVVEIAPAGAGSSWGDSWENVWGDSWENTGDGAAPDAIGGLILDPSLLEDSNKALVLRASGTTVFAFEGTRAPVSGDVGREVDLTFDAGVLIVDPDGSDAPRVVIVDVDEPRSLFFCTVMSAYRQY